MHFRMRVKSVGKEGDWWETYNKTGRDYGVQNNVHAIAAAIVQFYNDTLRPKETPRELLEVVKLPPIPRAK